MSAAAKARAAAIDAALKAAADKSAYLADDAKTEIRICAGTACHASGRVALRKAVDKALAERGLTETVKVIETGCHGFCQQGPIIVLRPKGIFYPRLKPQDVDEIIETSVMGDGVVERLLYRHPQTGDPLALEEEIPFYALQKRVVLSLNGKIDPYSIDDYLAHGGYTALAKVLGDADPQAVIAEIEKSGLRGRGGAGFPTARKWRSCRANPGEKHYIICNADEGDPGAFMDRSVLEGNAHSVIEGMIIAAYAIGADNGPVEATSTCGMSTRSRSSAWAGPSSRPGREACSARTSWARASTSTSASTREPAPSCAANRRPSPSPSRDSGVCPGASTSALWPAGCGASRPTSTMSRPTPTCPG